MAVGVEVTVSFGLAVTVTEATVVDSHGNVASQTSVAVGGGTPEASVEVSVETTNADNVSDLGGFAGKTTVGGGEGAVGSVSHTTAESYQGVSVSSGAGGGLPGSFQGQVEFTSIQDIENVSE